MSGRLLCRVAGADFWLIKHIRTGELEEHKASVWNSVSSPLRDCALGNLAQSGNSNRSAEIIDNFVCVHAQSIEL